MLERNAPLPSAEAVAALVLLGLGTLTSRGQPDDALSLPSALDAHPRVDRASLSGELLSDGCQESAFVGPLHQLAVSAAGSAGVKIAVTSKPIWVASGSWSSRGATVTDLMVTSVSVESELPS